MQQVWVGSDPSGWMYWVAAAAHSHHGEWLVAAPGAASCSLLFRCLLLTALRPLAAHSPSALPAHSRLAGAASKLPGWDCLALTPQSARLALFAAGTPPCPTAAASHIGDSTLVATRVISCRRRLLLLLPLLLLLLCQGDCVGVRQLRGCGVCV